jgi:hypothetical protein
MMKVRPTKCIFKVNHIFRISILLLHVSALQQRHLQESPKYPDEIVRMLRHKCRISEGREWITVCVLSAEGTERERKKDRKKEKERKKEKQ